MGSKNSNRRYILLRYVLVILFMLALSGAIVYKAVDVCIIHATEWNEKVKPELTATREIMPERGDILAHDGLILATSMTCYQAVIDFSVEGFDKELFDKELSPLCDSLAKYFPKRGNSVYTADRYKKSLQDACNKKNPGYILQPTVIGKDIRRLATFPFLKEPKKSKTGYYINQSDLGNDVYINFGMKSFDDKLFEKNVDSLCQQLGRLYPKQGAKYFEDTLSIAYNQRKNSPDKKGGKNVRILENASYSECYKLEQMDFLKEPKTRTGLNFDKRGGKRIQRVNPYGTMAARAVGKLNPSSQRGNSGLEMALDSFLFGVPGRTTRKQLATGMTDWVDVPAQRGLDVKTTIDVVIQDVVEEALEQAIQTAQPEFAVAIVMEVATGEIRAMSNMTRLANGMYSEECRNNAVLPYEPGSVVKALSMMIALDDGVVTPDEKIDVEPAGYFYEGGTITDTGYHPDLNVFNSMTYSSNIGLAKIIIKGYEDNPNRFLERIHEVGFMEPFNLGIAGEATPIIRFKPNENPRRDMASMAYGYAAQIPPIYTVALYNAIANDGKFVRPRLVKEFIRDGKVEQEFGVSYIREQMCKPETVQLLQEMLLSVVYGKGTGTAARSNKVKIAGKTGTAQIPGKMVDANGKSYITYETGKYRITFCGFFPYENPQYTCLVLLNNPLNPQYKGKMPPAGQWCGGAVKYVAETLYDMGRLETSFQSLPEVAVPFNPGTLQGDVNATNEVLQQLNIAGNTSQCCDVNTHLLAIPNVCGWGARDALYILENLGLKVCIQGQGKVVEQSIAPGSPIDTDATIVLKLK